MKCLLCNQQFNQEDQLKQHYINVHNVDSNNYFFMKLFKQRIICQKYLRCDNFLTTNKHKVLQNFLKPYSDDKTKPSEERSTEIKKIWKNYNLIWKITVGSHGMIF